MDEVIFEILVWSIGAAILSAVAASVFYPYDE